MTTSRRTPHRFPPALAAGLCLLSLAVTAATRPEPPATAAAGSGQGARQPATPTFRSGLDLVVVNVVVRDKNARVGRNPQTGEEITISARRVLTFKPSQVLKNALNS